MCILFPINFDNSLRSLLILRNYLLLKSGWMIVNEEDLQLLEQNDENDSSLNARIDGLDSYFGVSSRFDYEHMPMRSAMDTDALSDILISASRDTFNAPHDQQQQQQGLPSSRWDDSGYSVLESNENPIQNPSSPSMPMDSIGHEDRPTKTQRFPFPIPTLKKTMEFFGLVAFDIQVYVFYMYVKRDTTQDIMNTHNSTSSMFDDGWGDDTLGSYSNQKVITTTAPNTTDDDFSSMNLLSTILCGLQLLILVRTYSTLRKLPDVRIVESTFINCIDHLFLPWCLLLLISLVFGTVLLYMEPCYNIHEECMWVDVIDGLFYSLSTMVTVGYGNQVPATLIGRGVAVVEMIIGALFVALPLAIVRSKFTETVSSSEKNDNTNSKANILTNRLHAVAYARYMNMFQHLSHVESKPIARSIYKVEAAEENAFDRYSMDDILLYRLLEYLKTNIGVDSYMRFKTSFRGDNENKMESASMSVNSDLDISIQVKNEIQRVHEELVFEITVFYDLLNYLTSLQTLHNELQSGKHLDINNVGRDIRRVIRRVDKLIDSTGYQSKMEHTVVQYEDRQSCFASVEETLWILEFICGKCLQWIRMVLLPILCSKYKKNIKLTGLYINYCGLSFAHKDKIHVGIPRAITIKDVFLLYKHKKRYKLQCKDEKRGSKSKWGQARGEMLRNVPHGQSKPGRYPDPDASAIVRNALWVGSMMNLTQYMRHADDKPTTSVAAVVRDREELEMLEDDAASRLNVMKLRGKKQKAMKTSTSVGIKNSHRALPQALLNRATRSLGNSFNHSNEPDTTHYSQLETMSPDGEDAVYNPCYGKGVIPGSNFTSESDSDLDSHSVDSEENEANALQFSKHNEQLEYGFNLSKPTGKSRPQFPPIGNPYQPNVNDNDSGIGKTTSECEFRDVELELSGVSESISGSNADNAGIEMQLLSQKQKQISSRKSNKMKACPNGVSGNAPDDKEKEDGESILIAYARLSYLYKLFMIFVILTSLLFFVLSTLPFYQDIGEGAVYCGMVVEAYCSGVVGSKYGMHGHEGAITSKTPKEYANPGCFVIDRIKNSLTNKSHYEVTNRPLLFHCDSLDCFGSGYNFGTKYFTCLNGISTMDAFNGSNTMLYSYTNASNSTATSNILTHHMPFQSQSELKTETIFTSELHVHMQYSVCNGRVECQYDALVDEASRSSLVSNSSEYTHNPDGTSTPASTFTFRRIIIALFYPMEVLFTGVFIADLLLRVGTICSNFWITTWDVMSICPLFIELIYIYVYSTGAVSGGQSVVVAAGDMRLASSLPMPPFLRLVKFLRVARLFKMYRFFKTQLSPFVSAIRTCFIKILSYFGLVLLCIAPFAYWFYVVERGSPCYADENTNNSCGLGDLAGTGSGKESGLKSIYDGQLIMINYYLRHYFITLTDYSSYAHSDSDTNSMWVGSDLDLGLDPILEMNSLEEPFTDINPPPSSYGIGTRLFSVVPNALYGLWFSLVSITSIGYGDIYPTTYLGQGITVIIILLGTVYTAIPLSILIDTYIMAITAASDSVKYADKPHVIAIPVDSNRDEAETDSVDRTKSEFALNADDANDGATDELFLQYYIHHEHDRSQHSQNMDTGDDSISNERRRKANNIKAMLVLRTIYINLYNELSALSTIGVGNNKGKGPCDNLYDSETRKWYQNGMDDIEVCIPEQDEYETHVNIQTATGTDLNDVKNNTDVMHLCQHMTDVLHLTSHQNIATLLHHILSLNRCIARFRQFDDEQ